MENHPDKTKVKQNIAHNRIFAIEPNRTIKMLPF